MVVRGAYLVCRCGSALMFSDSQPYSIVKGLPMRRSQASTYQAFKQTVTSCSNARLNVVNSFPPFPLLIRFN